ncbi:MAG: ArsR/SmtB family transcription factor [Lachnospira sp.]
MTRQEVANICKAMSDSNRLSIIEMLTQSEKCGCNILEELQITQPTLSHHMKVLSDCGLVSSHKDGKWHYYSINCEKFKEYKDYIASITCCGNVTKDNTSEGCCETNTESRGRCCSRTNRKG